MVVTWSSTDIRRMRLPSRAQTRKTPTTAFPRAIHSPDMPNPQPILPAKPMNRTAEKYAAA